MGGSGGFNGYRPMSERAQRLASETRTQSSQREIEINEFLEALLKDFNNRDVNAIQTHLKEIEKVLGREIDGLDAILFGGSISKNTFIEGASDVDALVFMDSTKYTESSPKGLQEKFFELLKARFPNTEIKKGELAVTVKFSDYEIQLLPALRENGKIRISDRETKRWSPPINVSAFTRKLTNINQNNGKKVVPVIKLAKNLFSKLPQKYQLSGYHVEALAVEAFAAYNGRSTLYDMTKHLLDYSTKRVLTPMNDVTGQSGVIDSYLGATNSLNRQHLSHCIRDIAGRFSGSDATSVTKELFS